MEELAKGSWKLQRKSSGTQRCIETLPKHSCQNGCSHHQATWQLQRVSCILLGCLLYLPLQAGSCRSSEASVKCSVFLRVQPWVVIGVMSPKPTVVSVVKPKYKAVKKSFQGRSARFRETGTGARDLHLRDAGLKKPAPETAGSHRAPRHKSPLVPGCLGVGFYTQLTQKNLAKSHRGSPPRCYNGIVA